MASRDGVRSQVTRDAQEHGDRNGVASRPKPASNPERVRSVATTGIFGLAAIYTLYFGRSLLVPIVIAILAAFILAPAVRLLQRLRLPAAMASAVIVSGLILALVGTAYQLSGPAARWIDELPLTVRRLGADFTELTAPIASVREATDEVERMTEGDDGNDQPRVEVADGSMSASLFDITAGLMAQLVFALALLFALLASGDRVVAKLVLLTPGVDSRREMHVIARRTEQRVSRYLATVTVINVCLGLATALAMYLVGMPNPELWGVLAGLLNFVPFIGATITAGILMLAATTEFSDPLRMALPPIVFVALTSVEAYLVTPQVLSQRLRLNLVIVFLSLFFWGWLWGPVGALLAVPMLATVKIISEQVDGLGPLARLLDR